MPHESGYPKHHWRPAQAVATLVLKTPNGTPWRLSVASDARTSPSGGWRPAASVFRLPERPQAVPEAICVIGRPEAGRGPVMENFDSPGVRSGPDFRSRGRREKRNLSIALRTTSIGLPPALTDCSIRDGAATSPAVARLLLPDNTGHERLLPHRAWNGVDRREQGGGAGVQITRLAYVD